MLFLAALLLGSLPAISQARFVSNNGGLQLRPAQLARCKVQVTADPFVATTKMELEFYNPNDSVVEVRHRLRLEPGQAVAGLQLDLNGKFREGSIEEKWKARAAYQEVTGQRIDPALLQMEYGGEYSLRIYPVPGRGTRRVIITLQEVLHAAKEGVVYRLPLSPRDTLQEFEVSVQVGRCPKQPLALAGFLDGRAFLRSGDAYTMLRAERGAVPARTVSFAMPLPQRSWYCGWPKPDGSTGFLLHFQPRPDDWVQLSPKSAVVLWDASSYGRSSFDGQRIDFLRSYLWAHNIRSLTVLLLQGKGTDTVHFDLAQQPDWPAYLAKVRYEGYRSGDSVDVRGLKADVALLFTGYYFNGVVNAGSMPLFHIAIARGPVAYRGDGSRRELIPLVPVFGQTRSEAIVQASRIRSGLLELRRSSGKPLERIAGDEGGWTVFGDLAPGDTLQAVYGDVRSSAVEGRWRLPAGGQCSSADPARLQVLLQYPAALRSDWIEQLRYGARNGIVTNYTSYLVLERIEDYIKYNIRPPKELEEECARQHYVWHDRSHLFGEWSELELVQEAAAEYTRRLRLWDSKAPAVAVASLSSGGPAAAGGSKAGVAGTGVVQPAAGASGDVAIGGRGQSLDEVVVTTLGQVRNARELGTSVAKVRAAELTQGKVVNLQQGLTGKVSGLVVQQTNNGVFNDTRITLRGMRSLTGNNQPLVVLDGVPMPINVLSSMNPNDVQDVLILKSSSATAIYGPEAANGAILITSKRGNKYKGGYYDGKALYRLRDMEDEGYITEMKDTDPRLRIERYMQLRTESRYARNGVFYFDMAQLLFEDGHSTEAMAALRFAIDSLAGRSGAVKRSAAYMMEEWGRMKEALALHRDLVKTYGDIRSYRDLALALYRSGERQEAVDTLYAAVRRDWVMRAGYTLPWKGLLLQDLNMIVAAHRDELNVGSIPGALLRSVPVEMRIVVQPAQGSVSGTFEVQTPGSRKVQPSGPKPGPYGMIAAAELSSGFVEYQAREGRRGTYALRLRYFNGYKDDHQAPLMLRVMTFRQPAGGKPILTVHNVMLDYQWGAVEFDEVLWPQ